MNMYVLRIIRLQLADFGNQLTFLNHIKKNPCFALLLLDLAHTTIYVIINLL